SNQTRPEGSSQETQTAGKARPFAFPLLSECSVADAYPSPYAVTPTIDHRPPAPHAVAAISIGSVVGAAVCIVRSSTKAEPERESGCEAPAPSATTPTATVPCDCNR